MDIIKKFKKLGRDKNRLHRELVAMLPEIFEKRLFRGHADSIEEFAGKFAGISASVVKKALNLDKKFHRFPLLKETIKEVGLHKAAIVACIATPENEEILVEKVQNMSKRGLLELRKAVLQAKKPGLFAESSTIKIELDTEMTFQFLKLQKHFAKTTNKGTMRTILREMFENTFSKELGLQKKAANTDIPDQTTNRPKKQISPGTKPAADRREKMSKANDVLKSQTPRRIPTHLRRETLAAHNNRCAHPNCNRPHDVIHHQEYFAQTHSHDNLLPLCNIHHELIHNNAIKNAQLPAKNWQPQLKLSTNHIDKKFQKHRRQARK